jgi:hypothetical protein
VNYSVFEINWNESNDPNNWLNHLRKQGAYNDNCRCTKVGRATHIKLLYIQFQVGEKIVFWKFLDLKDEELAMWAIDRADDISMQRVPMHDSPLCIHFN